MQTLKNTKVSIKTIDACMKCATVVVSINEHANHA